MTPDDIIAELESRLKAAGLLGVVVDVADAHFVTVEDLLGQRRSASIVAARRAAMAAIYLAGKSMPEVGALLGRDHTTVLSHLRKAGVERRPRPGKPRLAAGRSAA